MTHKGQCDDGLQARCHLSFHKRRVPRAWTVAGEATRVELSRVGVLSVRQNGC